MIRVNTIALERAASDTARRAYVAHRRLAARVAAGEIEGATSATPPADYLDNWIRDAFADVADVAAPGWYGPEGELLSRAQADKIKRAMARALNREHTGWRAELHLAAEAAAEPARTVIACGRCDGTNVQAQVWANPNAGYAVSKADRDEWAMTETVWCCDCGDHVAFVERAR